MWTQVKQEINNRLTLKFIILSFLFIVALIGFGMVRSQSYSLRDKLDLFALVLSGTPDITFPLLAVLVYVAAFSEEVQNRFLVYTRMRRSLKETLHIKLIANIILSFSFFFSLIFITYIFVYYIDPYIVKTVFEPSSYGLTRDTIDADAYSRHTFTQLLQYGSFVYGTVYALWVGLNGALYAAIAFYLVLIIHNRFLALSLPYITYIVASFTLNALNLRDFRPTHTIFPFGYVQSPLWTVCIPFVILLVILAVLAVYVRKNLHKVSSLS
ncbi:hypothetical protein [Paenibacillus polymyxa]|uniref:hypothetical protein n=1 Tax=Paenibacillus polymyxa TaxID=1406 RepID=UPI0023781C26|nr:hypothetical protein [Paenibacillus polymyxa]WDM23111.1 hypothetical protein J4I02_06025 [Paenibacillus polymyxa]